MHKHLSWLLAYRVINDCNGVLTMMLPKAQADKPN